jgi:hypothetical protein
MKSKVAATYAVLTGLTPLIPVPIVDDWALSYLRRRLVRQLAAAHDYALGEDDVKLLAHEGGFLTGCLFGAFVYPLKILFRKVFFFLEWKRGIDTVSRTYAFAVLVDHGLAQRWCAPAGPVTAAQLRKAIDDVLAEVGTKVMGKAVGQAFRRSTGALQDAAALFRRALRGLTRRARRVDVEQAMEAVEAEQARRLEPVAEELSQAMDDLPPGYFDRMRALLAARLSI